MSEKRLDIESLSLAGERQHMIDVLLGENTYADKVLQNAEFVNVITREIYTADIAISGKYVLMVGDCKELIG